MSSDKRVELCVRTSTCTRFTIEPEDGYTVEQIVEMLNKGEVSLSPGSDSIVQHFPPPYDAMTVLARVRGNRVESDNRKWEIVQATDGDQSSK
jgi:hypothetical protein